MNLRSWAEPTQPAMSPSLGLSSLFMNLEQALVELSPTDCPCALGELERLKAITWAKMIDPLNTVGSSSPPDGDRLLNVDEAAQKLGLSIDFLYRHADRLPFTVRPSLRQLRFSKVGIEQYIRQRRDRLQTA
jgi:predicted DNA-binding transcriptional regulator AlpA